MKKIILILSILFNLTLIVILFLAIKLKTDGSKSLNPKEFIFFVGAIIVYTIINFLFALNIFKKKRTEI